MITSCSTIRPAEYWKSLLHSDLCRASQTWPNASPSHQVAVGPSPDWCDQSPEWHRTHRQGTVDAAAAGLLGCSSEAAGSMGCCLLCYCCSPDRQTETWTWRQFKVQYNFLYFLCHSLSIQNLQFPFLNNSVNIKNCLKLPLHTAYLI